MKNFLRRLARFVNDPRYGVFYSRWPVSPKEFWDAIEARTLAYQRSVGTDPNPGVTPYCTTTYREFCRELHPKLEWPDLLGNALFVLFCRWVLWRAFVSPAGLWIGLLVIIAVTVTMTRLSIQFCRMAWRTWFSRPKAS